ncbi:MAG: rhodanese-like domain-containing protein [Oligoflexus sp.]|jgi:rhodanese-related sulfurtransferase
MPHYKTITPGKVFDLYRESGAVQLIDVREADEFADCAPSIGVNVPLSRLLQEADTLLKDMDRKAPTYLFCRSGRRSASACEKLADLGFDNLYNVEGGILAWTAAGLPTRKA